MKNIFVTVITKSGERTKSNSPIKVDKSLTDNQITELVNKKFEKFGFDVEWAGE